MSIKLKKIKKLLKTIEKELSQKLGFGILVAIVFFSFNFPQHTVAYAQENSTSGEIIISFDTKDIQEYSPIRAEKTLPIIAEKAPIETMVVRATAYNAEVAQTDGDPCRTANGFDLCATDNEDTIAANFLPFGTKVKIPEYFGDRVFTVRDRMNARYGVGRIDVYMKDHKTAVNFGARTLTMYIY